MFEEFFNLQAQPFKLNPDPKFFFGSRSHNKAMAYLHYGLRQAEGFIVITGEIGAGKSILIGHLVDQLDRSSVIAAHLLTPNLEADNLISHILSAFRVEASGQGAAAEIEAFEDFLFDQLNRGRRVLLIVDEAQNLPPETLEELRILSNMDYDGTPLFQVFLVGQPDFRPILSAPGMEQLRQRIIASYHLQPLNREETQGYIEHRLTIAGWTGDPAITDGAFDEIFDATGGVPRKINKLCNRVLLFCAIEQRHEIDGAVVEAVVRDLAAEEVDPSSAADAAPLFEDKAEAPSDPFMLSAEPNGRDASTDFEVRPRTEFEPNPGQDPANAQARDDAAAGADAPEPERDDIRVIVPFAPVAQKKSDLTPETSEGDDNEDAEPARSEPPSNGAAAVEFKNEGDDAMSDEAKDDDRANEAGEDAEETVSAGAGETLLDKLKKRGKVRKQAPVAAPSAAAKDDEEAPSARAATIDEVANAIAAVGESDAANGQNAELGSNSSQDAAATSFAGDSLAMEEQGDVETPGAAPPMLSAPSIDDDPKGWRKAVLESIKETRTELKEAHAGVKRIRKQVGDIGVERDKRKLRVASSLDRAEALLSELRRAQP